MERPAESKAAGQRWIGAGLRRAVLAIGAMLSVALALVTDMIVDRDEAADSLVAGQSAAAGLQQALDRRIDFLKATKGLYEASDFVTGPEFARFSRLDNTIRGQGWWIIHGWAPQLGADGQGEVRHPVEGEPEGKIVRLRSATGEPIGPRAEGGSAYPLIYVEPSRRQAQFQDTDLLSRPDWRAAVERAAGAPDTATVSMTTVTLYGVVHPAVLILVPVAEPTVPPRPMGFVVGLFATTGMIEEYMVSSGLEGAFWMQVLGTDADGRPTMLYRSSSDDATPPPSRLQSIPVKIGNQTLIAKVAPLKGQLPLDFLFAAAIFLLGASATWGVYTYLERSRVNYERVAVEVARATAELNRANSELAVRSGTLERLAADLRQKTYEAELANTAKTMFLAHMSHEFRTPLNAILGFSEIIANQSLGSNPVKYSEYAHSIHESGGKLLAIIDDLLDLSRLELGEAQLKEEVIVVVDLAREAVAFAERDLPGGLGIIRGLDAADPGGLYGLLPIRGDRRLLREAIAILVLQAALRRRSGEPIRLTANADPVAGIRIAVGLQADGVTPEAIGDLNSEFWLQRADVARASGGRGLGLIVARRFVEAHGGTVEVASESEGFLTIALRLPAHRVVLPGPKIALEEPAAHADRADTEPAIRS